MSVQKGSCYCGKVEISVAGELAGGVLCHCHTCQKLHSHNSYNVQSSTDAITITKGEPKVFDDKSSDSGKSVFRYFCGDCASALYSAPQAMPGVAFVKVGCLDRRAEIAAVAEIYIETAMKHSIVNKPEIAKFEGMMAKQIPHE